MGKFRFFKRRGDILEPQAVLLSPDGRQFFHNGIWKTIPRGAAVNMIQGNSYFYDDFLGPFAAATSGLIASKCIYTTADGATVTRQVINGGGATLTIAADEADVASVFGPRAYEPDECGQGWMQARLRTSSIAAESIFVGMTDSDADTVTIEDEDGTLQTVPTDAFGVLLEGEQDATWQTMGVGNDVDDTQYASDNIADLAASTFTTIFIEYDRYGNAGRTVVRYRVRIDGVLMTTTNTDAAGWTVSVARSSIVYCPVVSADARNTAYTVNLVELAANGGVGTTLD